MVKVQNYEQGYINRVGDKYQYVVDGEVEGTYSSVKELVEDNGSDREVQIKPKKIKKKIAVNEDI